MGYTPKYLSVLEERREFLARSLAAIFGAGAARFMLEVGCGHGHFLTAYATAHPEAVCIGIDLIGERIERARKKCDRAGLRNLHFLQAEARLFLEVLPPLVMIEKVFVLFPDPWPKLRHNKHRIIQPSFLAALAARCAPGAPLYFRTDFTPYWRSAQEVFGRDPSWQLMAEPWAFEFATVFQQRAGAYHSLVARCIKPGATAGAPVTAIRNAD